MQQTWLALACNRAGTPAQSRKVRAARGRRRPAVHRCTVLAMHARQVCSAVTWREVYFDAMVIPRSFSNWFESMTLSSLQLITQVCS
jgi:hypothetical protein